MINEQLTIRTLGGIGVQIGETAVSGFVSRKADALLVYLACRPRPHARETLATMLWDDSPQQRSLANLSVLLTSLRKQLAPYLQISRHEIGLNWEQDIWVDARELSQKMANLPRSGKLTRATAAAVAQAVDLYQGPFLSGFFVQQAGAFSEWTLLEQERLQQLAITGMDRLTDFYLQRGRLSDGISLGMALVNLDPLREESHRRLMRLFTLSGQRNAALEQYQSCVAVLDKELGVPPAEETTALMSDIRSGAFPEQATAEKTIVKRVSAPPGHQHNLPAELTSFVGRETELAQIQSRLSDPACRLLTIVGPGGVGKTRLALSAARQQIGHFLNGVWVVPLASLPSADLLETAVADAIGFSFSGDRPARTQLLDFLSQKEMLLALDNFEHLLDDTGVGLITAILAQAPEVQLLVSSRERLNLQAEWLFEVGGLAVPNDPLSADVQQFGAVQLFCRRAEQQAPHFAANAETLPCIGDIVTLLEGMPLGIELAAANMRYYDCADVAAGIRKGLDFLQTNQRDLPARHRSLRAMIDRSWQLLTVEEQAAFAALSVFRGPFSPQAALAVLKSPHPVLHALVDKSLLQRLENGRYQMHNSLRQYAGEKLAAQPEWAYKARGRHGAFYAELLQQWQEPLKGGQQQDALEAIQADIENMRVGWQYAQTLDRTTPELIPLLSNALEALFHYYSVRSWFREGVTLFDQAVQWLSPPQNEAERILQARLRSRYGWFVFLLGERQAGEAALRESLALLSEADRAADVVFCHNYLGAMAFHQSNPEQAKMHLTQALALADVSGDVHGKAIGLNIMGVLHVALGAMAEAETFLENSLALKRQIGDRWGIAFSLEKLGHVQMAAADFDEAAAHLQESLTIRRSLGDQRGVALCLQRLGDLAQRREDGDTAVSLYHESLSMFEAIGDVQAVRRVQEKLGGNK